MLDRAQSLEAQVGSKKARLAQVQEHFLWRPLSAELDMPDGGEEGMF